MREYNQGVEAGTRVPYQQRVSEYLDPSIFKDVHHQWG